MVILSAILATLVIPLIGYRIYIDFFYITKKNKFNKSADAQDWYYSMNFFQRFLLGKTERRKYKILREEDEKEPNSGG